MTVRHLTPIDRLIVNLDQGLRTVFGRPQITGRPNPADSVPEAELDEGERRVAAGLMRVNHAGEVCAQALYQGQALTARLPQVRQKMEQASREENDHLAWCEQRLTELGSHTSRLNPLWYAGSVAIGAIAGLAGDHWSLGFVAETEHQVVDHLTGHLQALPEEDVRSRAIVEQMREDEGHHATIALEAGGAELPEPVRRLMSLTSKIMTRATYRL
jgi:ubiquinone biosynthesis monooxygenase Coq7